MYLFIAKSSYKTVGIRDNTIIEVDDYEKIRQSVFCYYNGQQLILHEGKDCVTLDTPIKLARYKGAADKSVLADVKPKKYRKDTFF